MTASPANANDTTRVLEEAGEWMTLVDSGAMSEEQRLEFRAWLEEPRNRRSLAEIETLVALIQELPENKATSPRTSRMPPHSIEADRRGIWTRPLAAITVAAAAVSVGSGAFGFSATLANSVGDWLWSGSSPSTTMHPVAAFVVSCGAGLAGSVWAALFFRRAMSK
jgi:ferric-dicitrate binding protein FerR (iron transport regulator)